MAQLLKTHYLHKERNIRIDHLIFLLQGAVDIDFRLAYFKITRGLQPLAWRQDDKKRRDKANSIPLYVAAQSIELKELVDDDLRVCRTVRKRWIQLTLNNL